MPFREETASSNYPPLMPALHVISLQRGTEVRHCWDTTKWYTVKPVYMLIEKELVVFISGGSRIQKRGVLEMTARFARRKLLHDHAHFCLATPTKIMQ